MKKVVKPLIIVVALFLAGVFLVEIDINNVNAENTKVLREYTDENIDEAIDYLNEVYIEKYPNLGIAPRFGSDYDKKFMKQFSDELLGSQKTDAKKVETLVYWVAENLEHSGDISERLAAFPLDVYYERRANCVGYAFFMQSMLQDQGIPAVATFGYRKDMNNFPVSSMYDEYGHTWLFCYFDGKWNVVDPLSGVVFESNLDYIKDYYFIEHLEGVSVYNEKRINLYSELQGKSYGSYYKDGVVRAYYGTEPFTDMPIQMWSNADTGWEIMYYINYKFHIEGGTTDGYTKEGDPNVKDGMENGQAYTDGWYWYGENSVTYATETGVVLSGTIVNHNDKTYYLNGWMNSIILPEKSENYSISHGGVIMQAGDSMKISATFEKESIEYGYVMVYSSSDESIAKVDSNGNIKALKEGVVEINVMSKDSVDDPGCHGNSTIIIMVIDGERKVNKIDKEGLEEPTTEPESTTKEEPTIEPESTTKEEPTTEQESATKEETTTGQENTTKEEVTTEQDSTEQKNGDFVNPENVSKGEIIKENELIDKLVNNINKEDVKYTEYIIDKEPTIEKTIFEELKQKEKDITIGVVDSTGNLKYSWTFSGRNFKTTDKDLKLSISFESEKQKEIETEIGKKSGKYIEFSHHGELPGPTTVKVYVGDTYKENEKVYLYYYNEEVKEVLIVGNTALEVKNGYVEFTITHCSTYFLDSEKLNVEKDVNVVDDISINVADSAGYMEDTKENDKESEIVNYEGTNNNVVTIILIGVVIAVALIGIIGSLVFVINKKKKEAE